MTRKLTLPTDSAERKRYPIRRGAVRYFPAAIAGVARISMIGNEKHNPGQEMHHARGKSADHEDCIERHAMDAEDMLAANARATAMGEPAPFTTEQILDEVDQHSWRSLAWAQEVHERLGAPLAPGARSAFAVPQTMTAAYNGVGECPAPSMADVAKRLFDSPPPVTMGPNVQRFDAVNKADAPDCRFKTTSCLMGDGDCRHCTS